MRNTSRQSRRFLAILFCCLGLSAALLPVPPAVACRNLDLNVGVVDNPEGRLFAQMMATFIHERTAVKTGMFFFSDRQELEAALEAKKVQIIVLDVADALAGMGRQPSGDVTGDYNLVRDHYRQASGFIWLEPFDFSGDRGLRAPVIREQILQKFPALPRVLAKLTRSIGGEERAELLANGNGGAVDPAEITQQFLLKKRLI